MPLWASDSYQINNITDSLTCIISSSDGEALVDLNIPPILICRLFMGGEELDAVNQELTYEYYYLWKRNGEDWREDANEETIPFLGKQLILQTDDLKNSEENVIVFSCEVYEENPVLNAETPIVAYGEINLDTTVKKWMTFDEQTGLWIRKERGEYTTLTDESGYHIYKIPPNILEENLYNKNELTWIASFAKDSLMVPRIRMGNIIAQTSTSSEGWTWVSYADGDEIDRR